MDINNDCFAYILQFLDIDDISKLSQTCKKYNEICDKHKIFGEIMKYDNNCSTQVYLFGNVKLRGKYAKIYSAMINKNFEIIKLFSSKMHDNYCIENIIIA